jgi:hypothetical protein
MAYTFFPKNVVEIKKQIKNSNTQVVNDIINTFSYLKNRFPKIESPININPQSPTKINITRKLQGEIDLMVLKRETKVIKISFKFGEGSAGGRGVHNKGNEFEGIFSNAIRNWWNGETDSIPKDILTTIEDISETYNLYKLKDLKVKEDYKFKVLEEGAANKKRPLMFSPKILIDPKPDNDIGAIVTDITLLCNDKPIVYLSAKFSTTVTFFNVGIKKILSTEQIKSGKITDQNGLKLLNLFNINDAMFCDVFNGKLKTGYNEDVWATMDSTQKQNLKELLASGIGQGYHVIHKLPGKIKSTKIDKNYLNLASTPKSCIVYYGGKGGTAKRIDMEITTGKYKLKLNMRDTQGSSGYPTRLMCDFTYL